MARKIIAPEIGKQSSNFESKNMDEITPAHRRALAKADKKEMLVTLAAQIAESNLFHRNYRWQDGDKVFAAKHLHMYRVVDKVYPYAKGGLLLVDEPKSLADYVRAMKKHQVLLEKNFRHVVILDISAATRINQEIAHKEQFEEARHVKVKPTEFHELLEQLGELPAIPKESD